MTIEEAVKADLLSLFGVNQAVYQTTRAAIEALVAQEEESRRWLTTTGTFMTSNKKKPAGPLTRKPFGPSTASECER
jgi:hypothetical protein